MFECLRAQGNNKDLMGYNFQKERKLSKISQIFKNTFSSKASFSLGRGKWFLSQEAKQKSGAEYLIIQTIFSSKYDTGRIKVRVELLSYQRDCGKHPGFSTRIQKITSKK